MDYDTDEKSMATLRRHLRRAREEYYRYKRYIWTTSFWSFQIGKVSSIFLGGWVTCILENYEDFELFR